MQWATLDYAVIVQSLHRDEKDMSSLATDRIWNREILPNQMLQTDKQSTESANIFSGQNNVLPASNQLRPISTYVF